MRTLEHVIHERSSSKTTIYALHEPKPLFVWKSVENCEKIILLITDWLNGNYVIVCVCAFLGGSTGALVIDFCPSVMARMPNCLFMSNFQCWIMSHSKCMSRFQGSHVEIHIRYRPISTFITFDFIFQVAQIYLNSRKPEKIAFDFIRMANKHKRRKKARARVVNEAIKIQA